MFTFLKKTSLDTTEDYIIFFLVMSFIIVLVISGGVWATATGNHRRECEQGRKLYPEYGTYYEVMFDGDIIQCKK